ncbi:MAG: response regulator [Armatimonadetes bacterium]|nr:response regulator [Armatimonadota bacterium]
MRSLRTDKKADRDHFKSARILIVDDEPANVRLLERLLQQAGHTHLRSIQDPRQAAAAVGEFQPDIILLDLQMPHLDGLAVMKQLQPHFGPGTFLPILVLTADTNPQTKREALAAGAKDFLTKPFEGGEFCRGALLEDRDLRATCRGGAFPAG